MILQKSKGGEFKYKICELLKCLFMFKPFSKGESAENDSAEQEQEFFLIKC